MIGVVFFWLVGYAIFYHYVLGRLMLTFVSRHFLTTTKQRVNPLYSLLIFGDLIYLESFLFIIEFSLLFYLIVKFGQFYFHSQVIEIDFALSPIVNPYPLQQQLVIAPLANLIRLFTNYRHQLYFNQSLFIVNQISYQVLLEVFSPYQQQIWLVQVYQSFFSNLSTIEQQDEFIDTE